jgi:uncharacterized protein
MTTLQDIYAQREKILKIAQECGLKDVRVFGSVAREEDTPESDIDFLVEYIPESKKGFDVFGFPIEMEEMFGRKVDMVFESGLYHVIRDDILREAKPLCTLATINS